MPSTDMLYEIKENIAHIEILSKPLVKCDATDPDRVPGLVGFRSGKRSALIKVDGSGYYRVKGCGNLTLGFNLQNMVYPPEQKEIRGVQFENTAFRELYFCKRIKEILEPHGYLVSSYGFNNLEGWERAAWPLEILPKDFYNRKCLPTHSQILRAL